MKLSVDSRCLLWAGLLLLAATCTVKAEDNSTAPDPGAGKGNASLVNATTPAPKVEGDTTTAPVSVPSNSSNATSPAPATSPTTTAHPTTHTTQAPVTKVTTTITTTVTSKEPVKTTNASATSASAITSSISATLQQRSGFDLGSFIGGIVLTLGLLAAVYFGCRFYNSKRGVRYRTIDEHEAII